MALKVFLNQLGQDVISFIESHGGSGGSGGGSLEKDITSNVTVGAANAGTFFPQYTSFTEFAEKLLRKDIAPTIQTTFSGSGLKEQGTSVNGTTITLKITNLSAVTVPINTIEFYIGNSLLDTQTFKEGVAIYTYTYYTAIEQDTTFKAILTYNTNQKLTNSGNFTFAYASYYGITALSAITDSDATSLAPTFAKKIQTTRALTWNNISLNNERFLYMYPASLGQLASIKDGNGFSQIDSYTRYEVNLTSPINGKTIRYYAYLLTDATTGNGFTQIYN